MCHQGDFVYGLCVLAAQDDVVARRHHLRESLCRNAKHGRASDPRPMWLLELGDVSGCSRTRSLRGLCNRPDSRCWAVTH